MPTNASIPPDRPVIVIPAYQPDAQLVPLVSGLIDAALPVLLVDDGSNTASGVWIEQAAKLTGVTVRRHSTNRGKGAALKTGFIEVLRAFPETVGVVAADADGQHAIHDIVRVADTLAARRDAVIWGARQWSKHTPWRSRLGHLLSGALLKWKTGITLDDTQTGLRGWPRASLAELCAIPYDRYEYEAAQISCLIRNNWPLEVIAIDTIYQAGNETSHFKVVGDAWRITRVMWQVNARK